MIAYDYNNSIWGIVVLYCNFVYRRTCHGITDAFTISVIRMNWEIES